MKEIVACIGYVLDFSILAPLISGHIKEELSKNAIKTVENILVTY